MPKVNVPIFTPPEASLSLVSKYLGIANSSRKFSNGGPLDGLFRSKLGEHFGIDPEKIVLVANATLALEAAAATYGGNRVWELPSWSFTASGLALLRTARHGMVFGDVDSNFGVLQPSSAFVNTMGVLPFGSSLSAFRNTNFNLIDGAASFGGLRHQSNLLGQDAGLVVSLHATKSLSSGEGGIFISKNQNWVEEVRSYINFGFRPASRESFLTGTNGKFSEISAAFGLASLDSWEKHQNQYQRLMSLVKDFCSGTGLVLVGGTAEGVANPYWVIKLENEQLRDKLMDFLERKEIETRLWWGGGMHKMPAFSLVKYRNDLENTNLWAKTYLGLPFFPDLSKKQLNHIFASIETFLEQS